MTASSIKTQHTFVQLFLVGGQIILREQASLLYLQLAVHWRGVTLWILDKKVYMLNVSPQLRSQNGMCFKVQKEVEQVYPVYKKFLC